MPQPVDSSRREAPMSRRGAVLLVILASLVSGSQVGSGLFAGGKWSYAFKLKKNGKTLWEKDDLKRENDAEIKYWKPFKLVPDKDGSVSVSENILKDDMKSLKKFILQLEEKLNKSE